LLNLGQQVTLVQEVSLNLVQRREDLGEEDLSSPVLQELVLVQEDSLNLVLQELVLVQEDSLNLVLQELVLVQEDLLNLVLLELEDLAIQVDQVHLVDLTKF